MKRLNLVLLLTILFLCGCAYLLGTQAFALASAAPTVVPVEPTPTPMLIEVIYTPTPVCKLTPPPKTPQPELPDYEVASADLRSLSSALWSICPAKPTISTKQAFCELVQNRVDDASGDFKDTVPDVLLQPHEFLDYDARAYRSRENNAIAEYTLQAWLYAELTGNRVFRLLPRDGLYCDFYRLDGWDYIKVYNRAGEIVFDSGITK